MSRCSTLLSMICTALAFTAACSKGGSMSPTDDGVCPLPETTADVGALTVTDTQLCNFPGSMGKQHWYRLVGMMPGSTVNYVQVELYDKIGPFVGTTVHTGTFAVDPDPANCGVCVRGMGDKGAATAKEYYADGGTVNVTAVGAAGEPMAVTLSDLTFVQVDSDKKIMADGCTADVAAAALSGTVVQMGGTGGGTGGGGGGGKGNCPQTVGD